MIDKITRVIGPLDIDSMFGKPEAKPMQRPLAEAQIMELRHAARNYGRCPYKVGDLVAPRGNSLYRGEGEPHLVLEVISEPKVEAGEGDPSSSYYGSRLDMRVLMMDEINGKFCTAPFWVESWYFEPYEERR